MTDPFGGSLFTVVSALHPRPPESEIAHVHRQVAGLAHGGSAELHLSQPPPTAAFSRRDLLLAGYRQAEERAVAHGFTPIVRPVGGHLAAYDEGALVLHLWGPHTDARSHIRARFALLGGALAHALGSLGVDARLGPVPGEYCDGEFSVNHAGRAKLAGTGQRITRAGYLFSAVVMVREAGPARQVLTEAYQALGLDFRPSTVGCVEDSVPGITITQVRERLLESLGAILQLTPAAVGRLAEPA